MSNSESVKLVKMIPFECYSDDDCNLSDELTTEGTVTPNAVRKAVSEVSINKSSLERTIFKTVEGQNNLNSVQRVQNNRKHLNVKTITNKKLMTTGLNGLNTLQKEETNPSLFQSQKLRSLDFGSDCRRVSSSLKSDISSLLKQMIKNKQEKQIECYDSDSIEEYKFEELISMNDVGCADVFCTPNLS